jgi:sec-independent protein translocase protein TatA
LAVVVIIALIVFGPKRLPELGKSMGKGIREFRASISGKDDDDDKPEIESGAKDGETVEGEVVTDRRS